MYHNWAMIGLDSSFIFEAYIEDATVVIYLVGYTDDSWTFKTNAVDVSLGAFGAWTDIDVTASTSADTVGVVLEIENQLAAGRTEGVRKNGSADARNGNMGASSHYYVVVGVDNDEIFEMWAQDTNVNCYLVGYIETGAGATFNTNGVDKSLAGAAAWTDIDCSASAPDADCLIFEVFDVGGGGATFGLRVNGSSSAILQIPDTYHSWAVVPCDENQIVEGYVTNLNTDFYLIGYITDGAWLQYQSEVVATGIASGETELKVKGGCESISGARFDGTTGYVDLQNVVVTSGMWMHTDNFTISFWASTDAFTSVNQMVIHNTNTTDDFSIAGIGYRTINYLGQDKNRLFILLRESTHSETDRWITDNTVNLSDDTMYSCSVVCSGGALTFYINGASVGIVHDIVGNITGPNFYNTGTALGVAKVKTATGSYFDGVIDEVQVYSRALGAPEVLANYNLGREYNPAPTDDTNLEAWYKLNTTEDSSVSGYDATVVNGVSWETDIWESLRMVVDGTIYPTAGAASLATNPAKYVNNPIFGSAADTWDFRKAYNTVLTDSSWPEESRYRMWYGAIDATPHWYCCYAYSSDGINWTKPNLGLYSYGGNTNNNIIMPEDYYLSGFTYYNGTYYLLDHMNGDSLNAYIKIYSSTSPTGPFTLVKTLATGGTIDVGTEIVRRADGRWVAFYQDWDTLVRRQGCYLSDTTDITGAWTDQGVVIGAGAATTATTQKYSIGVTQIGGTYYGFVPIYNSTTTKIYKINLYSSADCVTWTLYRDAFLTASESPTWDYGMVIEGSSIIEVDEELWYYYSGVTGLHVLPITVGYIGLAKIEKDVILDCNVPDNTNDWIFTPQSYWDYYKHTVDGSLIVHYEPDGMLTGATLPDLEGAAQDGTITWGANSNLSLHYGAMVSSASTSAATSSELGFDMPDSSLPSTWFASGANLASLPFYDSFLDVSNSTGQPLQVIYFMAALGLAFGVFLLVVTTVRSALLGVIAFNIVLFVGSSMTVVPMWLPFVILIVQIGIMYLYRQVAY
jgi:hypothetical protein